MSEHPSHLALDRARLGAASAEVMAHLEVCPTCRAALDRGAPGPVPGWARRLEAAKPRRWLAPGVGLAGAGLAVLLFTLTPTYVAEKGGGPALDVYRLRDGVVESGLNAPVRSGDRLQLALQPGDFRRAYVLAPGEDGFVVLHSELVSTATLTRLSKSFLVDDAPGAETMVVVLSRVALSDDVLKNPPRVPTAEAWVQWLRFEREM
ncbi:MAG: hypothetical protein H6730_27175 [Deltaproteobacteria bacterium]|nr:hypothetical protein [Deltaproteobacteria bacterium]